jgi:hypothetical protein
VSLALRPLFGLLALALGAAGCGGGGGEPGAGTAPVPSIPGEEVVPATTFTSSQFEPQFTIELPEGWRPLDEEPGRVQIVSGATEGRALTFSSALAEESVPEAMDLIRTTPSITGTEPVDVTVAGHPGQVFTAEVEGDTQIPGLEYFAVSAFEIRIWAIDVGGTTVVLIADALANQAERFFAEVEQVLRTLEFGEA